jgi:hypothetical protein
MRPGRRKKEDDPLPSKNRKKKTSEESKERRIGCIYAFRVRWMLNEPAPTPKTKAGV